VRNDYNDENDEHLWNSLFTLRDTSSVPFRIFRWGSKRRSGQSVGWVKRINTRFVRSSRGSSVTEYSVQFAVGGTCQRNT
jgi:hypothetical protein